MESFTSAAGIPRLLLLAELLVAAPSVVVSAAMGLDGRASCELSGCDVLGCAVLGCAVLGCDKLGCDKLGCDKGWAIGGGDGCALRRGAELREPDCA